ncbi:MULTISPECIES: tRNA (adenosine(37)-N6)-threonylcarbamoyltransferase complex ATPase subunit type 1 TsaE [unclassified Sedimentibacter]|uniref:tRNA (adenosine(37)-N6)-threonylcarbamoyltransferase complex ATPase subunit type 1 TsaE n=1 Tax=unclassified Sedimentibacter TaxID=2649220 RepID=UPI0027E06F4D|nr:tRNA (adenosine(37)-N6)-threonylcarbamoyltransferase complex ATPase subunit type 1 TsaE [Sedimentibacter sp. MB35-C1]WMJ76712.1 tRNA (adenosine(37)-N6)-threonylcarbamoyltransferase complex ATPase subunit type 1 TsaE [Sedimentibacter sp. MB35-C1]
MKLTVNNLKDTEVVGRIIGRSLEKGSVLCLDGDLGVGKTALTQFIASELGVKEYITSPTFTIIKEYEGRLKLNHMDVYRIDSEEAMYDLGYDEYIYSEGATIIEWSHKIKGILPKERIDIKIERLSDTCRIMNISGNGKNYEKIAEELNKYESTGN